MAPALPPGSSLFIYFYFKEEKVNKNTDNIMEFQKG